MKFELGPGLKCDLQKLIDSRALVQANSGGGKSHTLRRLLEQTHGHVQQLVIDPEGEFASLRERYDYVLAARNGGDTAADPRAAKLLAERLLELGVSAILDIYELKAHERIRFVRAFLEALVDAPKTLWHPALVVVDEAHVFCPQQGEAESAGAVIDLCTRGRKRGFSAILATQRLSKLHKDAAAELNNKLIGRTGLDVDRKRAGEELGFTTKEQLLSLRQLEPGHFYAFGPALSLEVKEVQVGPVETTHPKAGSRIAFTPPPPTEKVKALLPQLADLPAEAEHKAKSEADLKKELQVARATITKMERQAPVRIEPRVETKVERVAVPMLTEEHLAHLKAATRMIQETFASARGVAEQLVEARGALSAALQRIDAAIAQATQPVQTTARQINRGGQIVPKTQPRTVRSMPPPPIDEDVKLTSAQQAILNAAAFLESLGIVAPDAVQLALFAGQSATGGYWRANIGRVRTLGLVQGTQLTDQGRALAVPTSITTVDELHRHVLENLLQGAERKILQVLLECYPETLDPAELGQRAGLEASGGYWRACIGRLRSLGLITKRGPIAALPVLFLEGAA